MIEHITPDGFAVFLLMLMENETTYDTLALESPSWMDSIANYGPGGRADQEFRMSLVRRCKLSLIK